MYTPTDIFRRIVRRPFFHRNAIYSDGYVALSRRNSIFCPSEFDPVFSSDGKFQVVTENTLFAMPETALGSFPDLGASYYLSRLPGFFGEYLGLTGARLNGAEMLACGLATHFVPSVKLASLEEALDEINTTDPFVISSTISKFSEVPNLKKKSAYHRLNIINKCFSQRTVEDIIAALEVESAVTKEDWISFSINSLKKASPISLKITLRSIREGRLQGIAQCLVREFRTICHVFQGKISKDCYEGCRAILLDKDQNPKWEPSRINLITKEMVDGYFRKVEDDDWADLNLTAHAIAKL